MRLQAGSAMRAGHLFSAAARASRKRRQPEVVVSCEYDPLWYDCDKYPCADCPWKPCEICGQFQQDCDCMEQP